jgi:hypothetical protein
LQATAFWSAAVFVWDTCRDALSDSEVYVAFDGGVGVLGTLLRCPRQGAPSLYLTTLCRNQECNGSLTCYVAVPRRRAGSDSCADLPFLFPLTPRKHPTVSPFAVQLCQCLGLLVPRTDFFDDSDDDDGDDDDDDDDDEEEVDSSGGGGSGGSLVVPVAMNNLSTSSDLAVWLALAILAAPDALLRSCVQDDALGAVTPHVAQIAAVLSQWLRDDASASAAVHTLFRASTVTTALGTWCVREVLAASPSAGALFGSVEVCCGLALRRVDALLMPTLPHKG